jgi:hypothetical protein
MLALSVELLLHALIVIGSSSGGTILTISLLHYRAYIAPCSRKLKHGMLHSVFGVIVAICICNRHI